MRAFAIRQRGRALNARFSRFAGWLGRRAAASKPMRADGGGSEPIRRSDGTVVGAVEFHSDRVLSGWLDLLLRTSLDIRVENGCGPAPLTFVPRPDLPRSAQGFFCTFPAGLQEGDRIVLSLGGQPANVICHRPKPLSGSEAFSLHYDEPHGPVARRHVRCNGWIRLPRAVGRIRFFVGGAEQPVSFHPRWDAMLVLGTSAVVGFEFEFDLAAFGQDIAIDCTIDGYASQRLILETRAPNASRSKDDLFLFMHIPKTAGTSVANAFRRQPSLEACWLYPSERFSFPEQVAALGDRVEAFDLIGGHFTYGLHRNIRRNCRYVTFFRQPQDLVISYFNYVKHVRRQSAWADLSLREAVLQRADWHLDNPLTRYLADVASTRALTSDDVRRASARMRQRFAVVGIIDRMDESLRRLSQEMGFSLGSVGFENRTAAKDCLSENEDELAQLLRPFTEFDQQLYAEAQARL